jgi:glycine cleavage system H protein
MDELRKVPQTSVFKKDLYYTNDHEWIDFQGSVAYIGICPFKLAGVKKIERIELSGESYSKKCGEVIASIFYGDYKTDVHMPVDGNVISFNEAILSGDQNRVLLEPETSGYIALIVPACPENRQGLIMSSKYPL